MQVEFWGGPRDGERIVLKHLFEPMPDTPRSLWISVSGGDYVMYSEDVDRTHDKVLARWRPSREVGGSDDQ